MTGRGVLFLVVGPSGVGKDTLIDAGRAALAADPRFVFAQRWITRPHNAGGENHHAVSEAEFLAAEAHGAFMLSWQAHGLRYGVPAEYTAGLAGGRHVVVNVSRGVIEVARAKFAPTRVLSITASPAALRKRLLSRGREAEAEIESRVARAEAVAVEGADVTTIVNDANLERGVTLFVAALKAGAAAR